MSSKIGPKELALKSQREGNLSEAHKMMIADGLPAKFAKTGPRPAPKKPKPDAGVTLAPPPAIQKAIAADFKDDPPSIIDESGKAKVGTLVKQDDLTIVAKAVAKASKPKPAPKIKQVGVVPLATLATIAKPPAREANQEATMTTAQTVTSKKSTPAAVKAKPKAAAKAAPKAKEGKRKPRYDFDAAEAAAKTGKLPAKPALSHKSYRKHVDAIEKLAKDGDLAGLKKYEPTFAEFLKEQCSFRTPLAHYRRNCITALSK